MIVGIVGLGLIGGSLAKAYKRNPDTVIYASDTDSSILEFAMLSGAVDKKLDSSSIKDCNIILIAIPPSTAREWLYENAHLIDPETLVMDCCGTKRSICEAGFALAKKYGFEFAGGHPMAGTHKWGFKNSSPELFEGACMVVVPRIFDDIRLLERIREAAAPAGFSSVSVTTAEKHDEVIAFTSQLAHAVSNAYVKSPTALEHSGVSAGSYQDLTRVAWLNPEMWADLFLENSDNLTRELDSIISSLQEYRRAMSSNDREELRRLLEEGRLAKESIDGHKTS